MIALCLFGSVVGCFVSLILFAAIADCIDPRTEVTENETDLLFFLHCLVTGTVYLSSSLLMMSGKISGQTAAIAAVTSQFILLLAFTLHVQKFREKNKEQLPPYEDI